MRKFIDLFEEWEAELKDIKASKSADWYKITM